MRTEGARNDYRSCCECDCVLFSDVRGGIFLFNYAYNIKYAMVRICTRWKVGDADH